MRMNLQFSFWHNNCISPGEVIMRLLADMFFLFLFFVLVVVWLLAWAAFHMAGGAVHLLLIIAVISLIVHFFRGRRSV
jgi:hypothetical protein